jgi:hypothetical protein
MSPKKNKYPACFGHLEKVFPMTDDGLRHTPETCMACSMKTDCLRTAMGKAEGLDVREEIVDRSYRAGSIGFLSRWSKKKKIHRKKGDGSHENHS